MLIFANYKLLFRKIQFVSGISKSSNGSKAENSMDSDFRGGCGMCMRKKEVLARVLILPEPGADSVNYLNGKTF